jgi:hypothetical protein
MMTAKNLLSPDGFILIDFHNLELNKTLPLLKVVTKEVQLTGKVHPKVNATFIDLVTKYVISDIVHN